MLGIISRRFLNSMLQRAPQESGTAGRPPMRRFLLDAGYPGHRRPIVHGLIEVMPLAPADSLWTVNADQRTGCLSPHSSCSARARKPKSIPMFTRIVTGATTPSYTFLPGLPSGEVSCLRVTMRSWRAKCGRPPFARCRYLQKSIPWEGFEKHE
jgi:hypothetical protein